MSSSSSTREWRGSHFNRIRPTPHDWVQNESRPRRFARKYDEAKSRACDPTTQGWHTSNKSRACDPTTQGWYTSNKRPDCWQRRRSRSTNQRIAHMVPTIDLPSATILLRRACFKASHGALGLHKQIYQLFFVQWNVPQRQQHSTAKVCLFLSNFPLYL